MSILGGGILGNLGIPKHPQVEFYEDQKEPRNKWRWRITFSSDIVGASSQGYATKELAKQNLLSLEGLIKMLREENMI